MLLGTRAWLPLLPCLLPCERWGGEFLREWREGDTDREATRVVVTARVSQVLRHERGSGGRVRRRAGAAVLIVVRWCYYHYLAR